MSIYNGIFVGCEKNEILPFAATQMNLEIIILNEAEKDNFMISFICAI